MAVVADSLILMVFAQRLGASAATIGLIFASSGAGSVLGALASGPLQRRYSFRQIVVGTNWVLALTWPLYILAPNALALGVVNAIIFVAVPVYMGAQYSHRLALIPDALQGRVNSAFRLISYGVQPLSLALTGGAAGGDRPGGHGLGPLRPAGRAGARRDAERPAAPREALHRGNDGRAVRAGAA